MKPSLPTAMKRFGPHDKGHSPDTTSMAKVAKVAGGAVDSGNTAKQGINAPTARINRLENGPVGNRGFDNNPNYANRSIDPHDRNRRRR